MHADSSKDLNDEDNCMKTLIVTLCAGLAGVSWLGSQDPAALEGPAPIVEAAPSEDCAAECAPRLECSPSGECILVCTADDGEVCRIPVPCPEAPCDSAASGVCPEDAASECRVEVGRGDADNCRVTCTDPSGEMRTIEVACPRG